MRLLRWTAPVLALSMGACAWWMAGRPGLQNADELTFDHILHFENDVECGDCHDGIEAATNTAVSFKPVEETCMDCHDREDNCDMCHSAVDQRRERFPHSSELGFSHALHVGKNEIACTRCHPGSQAEEGSLRPSMSTCLSCHNHQLDYDSGRCRHCHDQLSSVPLRAVSEFEHKGDWLGRHGMSARVDGAACAQCHTQSVCSDCHSKVPGTMPARLYPEAVERTLLHRGDFVSVHAIEARADGDTCVRCHADNFCQSCHGAVGLTAEGANTGMPHPAGYATRGSVAFHGDDARMHIETCAACHDQGAASNCVDCHRSGGLGGSPHPQGWGQRHPLKEVKEQAVCQACHLLPMQ